MTRYAIAVVVLCSMAKCLHAEGPAKYSCTVESFNRLPPQSKSRMVHAAFRHRLEHAQNISYDSTMVLRNHRYDTSIGGVVWEGLKYGYQHWKLGDSYLVKTRLYGAPSSVLPKRTVWSSYDDRKGVTEHSKGVIKTNRYSYWLDGQDNGFAEHLFVRLANARENYVFPEIDSNVLVSLEVPWEPYGIDGADGVWRYELDPLKGFLPISGQGSWRKAEKWRNEQFDVLDSTLVSGVWMPTSLKEIVRASTASKGQASVYLTTVSEIAQGTVTRVQLDVEFQEGMGAESRGNSN